MADRLHDPPALTAGSTSPAGEPAGRPHPGPDGSRPHRRVDESTRGTGPGAPVSRPRAQRVPEAFVAWLWERRELGVTLETTDGRRVDVVYPGRRAGSWGPDFHGALLVVEGVVTRGDVEVHVRARDWRLHGHESDPAYASTALHVVFEPEGCPPAAQPDGALLPTVALAPLIREPLALALARWRSSPPPRSFRRCLTPEEAEPLLERAGMDRFRRKADRFEADLTLVAPRQALWTGVLETLGYAANTGPFRRLAERVLAAEADDLAGSSDPLLLPSVMFGESGLLPSQRGRFPLDDYTHVIERLWRETGRAGPNPPLGWRWAGCRPGNSPVRRVAAAVSVIADPRWPLDEGAAGILGELPPGRAAATLRGLLLREGDPYWRTHGDFGRPLRRPGALIGSERAADGVVNALLPWAAALSRRPGSPLRERDIEAIYRAHRPLAPNQITRHMALQILGAIGRDGVSTACRQQGLIAIYSGWCDARDCPACPAGPLPRLRSEAIAADSRVPGEAADSGRRASPASTRVW